MRPVTALATVLRGCSDELLVSLPKNLLLAGGSVIAEGFENAADWTIVAGSAVDDAVNFVSGSKSLKITNPAGSSGSVRKTVAFGSMSGFKRGSIQVYLTSALSGINYMQIRIGSNADLSVRMSYSIPPTMFTKFVPGWNRVDFTPDLFSSTGGCAWANNMISFGISCNASAENVISFDDLRLDYESMPAVLLMFDDGYASQYTEAFTYMSQFCIPGTLFMVTNNIGTAGNVTAAQLQEMQAGGWTIGNHTAGHSDLTALSQAQQEAALAEADGDLTALGLTGGKYVAYPGGGFNAATYLAMAATGMLVGRGTHSFSGGRNPVLPPYDIYQVEAHNVTTAEDLAAVQGHIDTTITRGRICPLLFHSIGTGAGNWTVADFRSLIDYIRTKTLAGLITPINIDQYYRLTLGPVGAPQVI